MNAMSEPEAEGQAAELAVGPADSDSEKPRAKAKREAERNFSKPVWEPNNVFGPQRQFDDDPCGKAVEEARMRVYKIKKQICNLKSRIKILQNALDQEVAYQLRVEAAYDHFCETGEIDRELLVPDVTRPKQIAIAHAQRQEREALERNAQSVMSLLMQSNWTSEQIYIDGTYEYIKFQRAVDASEEASALASSEWVISEAFQYLTIRRVRRNPPNEDDIEAQLMDQVDFIFKWWDEDPKVREWAIASTKSQWEILPAGCPYAKPPPDDCLGERVDPVDSEPRAPPD